MARPGKGADATTGARIIREMFSLEDSIHLSGCRTVNNTKVLGAEDGTNIDALVGPQMVEDIGLDDIWN